MQKIERKIMSSCSIILTLVLILLSTSSAAAADKNNAKVREALTYGIDTSDIEKIEVNENALDEVLAEIDDTDGFDEDELSQLEEVANVTIEENEENGVYVTNYIVESTTPLAEITRTNGSVENLNEKIVYSRMIVKDSNKDSTTTTKYGVYCKTELTYFSYEPGAEGKTVVKLIRTDFTILKGYENLSQLRIDYQATSTDRYDENAGEIKSGTETGTGRTHKVSSNGLYTEHTGTEYYYGTYASNFAVIVTINLTYKSTAESKPASNPYAYKVKI